VHRYGTGTYFFTMRDAVSSKDSNFSIFLGDIRIRTGLPRVYVNGEPRLPGLSITVLGESRLPQKFFTKFQNVSATLETDQMKLFDEKI